MDDPQKNDVSVVEVEKKECTMCKFVLIFAFIALIAVAVFAYIVRRQAATSPQIPIEQTIPLTGAEIDELMLELKGTVAFPANPHIKPTFPTEPKK